MSHDDVHDHDSVRARGNGHPHAGEHAHAGNGFEDYAARAHPEFVVLEIGGGLGALLVETDPAMHGVEIEISREGEERDGAHKQVLERGAGARTRFTAVFDGLPAGRYTLWVGDVPRAREVEVEAGHVAELDWRST